MLDIQGYQNIKKLYEGREQVVYSALRQDGLRVILKALRSERPKTDVIALMYHEYDIAKNLSLPGVIQTYDLIDQQNQYVLVQEDIGGISLHEYLKQKPIRDLLSFFKLALTMASIIEDLHRKFIIHKDIKPGNFIINPETLILKLTDFNFSSRLLHEEQEVVSPSKLEGTLLYMAPEQTGRMNMNIDYRADFYSLGVAFYEMLTGELPFLYNDPLELIHAHLATPLPILSSAYFEIPPMLTKIIKKMAAKNPIDRYQSAIGLKADLERCQNEFEKTGKIDDFPLGKQEVFDRLNLSQKLYGREAEAKKLLKAYDRVCQGAVEIFMVSGYSGIGKTKLVSEVHKPMVKQKGYFISGKFDQLQRNTPYTAITQALNQLARQILAEPEDRFETIKKSIIDALGGVAQVMIDLAPDVELIIGPQPPLDKLPSQETQNRMMLFFKRFLRVIAQSDHPLVLFIDDLQWIDSPSLKLLEYIMTDTDLSYVLLIGAYRDNEVDENHILKHFFREMKENEKVISTLILAPLMPENFQALFKDSFHRDDEIIKPFSDLLHKRTDGNPFFCKQVINTLYQEKLLYFDYENGQWAWNLDGIIALKITNNVVDLMLKKLGELPQETQTLLNYAACVGNRFTIEILMVISGHSPEAIGKALWPALEKDLIFTQRSGYKLVSGLGQENLAAALSKDIVYQFIHDRVQQAVYQGISEDKKKHTHLDIAQLLMKKYPAECQKERLFEVSDHFNEALDLLHSAEKIEVMHLNHQAGIQAKSANAYQSMFNYLTAALKLMDENTWSTDYDFAFQLNRDYALSLFLHGEAEKAETLTENLLTRAQTNLDKVSLYRIQILSYTNRGEIQKVLEVGALALGLLGVPFSTEPTRVQIFLKFAQIRWRMRSHNIKNLEKELPIITAPSILAAFEILMELIWPANTKSTESAVYLYLVAMLLELDFGKPPNAVLWSAAYGILLITIFKNVKLTFQYMAMADRLFLESPPKYMTGAAYMLMGFHLNTLCHHFKEGRIYLQQGLRNSIESGNIIQAAHLAGTNAQNIWAEAKSLTETLDSIRMALKNYSAIKLPGFHEWFQLLNISFENLSLGEDVRREQILALEQSIYKSEGLLIRTQFFRVLPFYYYFMESYEQVIHYHNLWYPHEDKIRFDAASYEVKTLGGLAFARHISQTRGLKKWRAQKALKRITGELKWISGVNPGNYLHHYLFLMGALEKLRGNYREALMAFSKAIQNAKKGDFYLWAALGNELIADMLIEDGQPRSVMDYVREAYYYYSRYGMTVKVKSLEKRYPQCFIEQMPIHSATQTGGSVDKFSLGITTTSTAGLDFMSVMKATQTISGEIVLEKLFEKMLHILVENAGAEKALFLECHQNKWFVAASLMVCNGQEEFKMQKIGLKEFSDIPQSVIQYVLRSEEAVVLSNAAEDSQHRQDPYIDRTQPKSVLCVPILHQDKLIGIIYLENNLAVSAFTQDRITVLTTLASQIAISLENARHFEVMENLYRSTERFVPKPFLSLLNKETIEQIKVGDSAEVNLAPLFADIRNFTSFSEVLGTEKTAFLLNSYMQTMAPIIRKNHGFVSQFFGDGIMALFPRRHSDAFEAALQMRAALPEFNQKIKAKGFEPINMGIGINAGPTMLITLGEEGRIDPSVISDVVNSAARIEGLNKLYGTGLLFSEAVFNTIENPSQYFIRLVDKVKVKGKQQAMKIYEPILLQAGEEPSITHFINQYHSAFSFYEAGNIKEALASFRACLVDRPEDPASTLMIKRCEEFLLTGLPKDWGGTYTALEK